MLLQDSVTIAISHYQAGDFQSAQHLCHEILQHHPDCVEALNLLGIIAYCHHQTDHAIAYYQKIVLLQPDWAEAHNNLANIYQMQGQFGDAIVEYQHAIALKPNYPEAYNNLGTALLEQGDLSASQYAYEQAIALNPNYAEAFTNIGNLYRVQNSPVQAVQAYQRAIALNPRDADAYNNLGSTLQEHRQMDDAIACFDRALALSPDYVSAQWNRSLCLLTVGDLQRGFAEYECRSQAREIYYTRPDRFVQPLWDGSPLQGKRILLHTEVGFGDTLQFIRYAALVQQKGGYTIVACPQPLLRLLQTVPGIDCLVPAETPLPEFDVHSPVLSLPHCFGTTLDTIPAPIPYITPPELPIDLGSGYNVGIVWTSGSRERSGSPDARDCPIELFLKLLAVPHVQLYSLQVGQAVADLTDDRIYPLHTQIQDFADTAHWIAQLDLVITVDTAVAHLAGAMGKPVWTLLPFVSDWRWLLERNDTPWYPTMQLFRQTEPNHWEEVFDRIVNRLVNQLANQLANQLVKQLVDQSVA